MTEVYMECVDFYRLAKAFNCSIKQVHEAVGFTGTLYRELADAIPSSIQDAGSVREALDMLLRLVDAINYALDDSEEQRNGSALIDKASYEAVCEAFIALDALPDDQPGYTMTPNAKARWALRSLSASDKTGSAT